MILGGGFNICLCSALGVRFPCSLPWKYGRKSDIFERVVQPPTMCISYLYIYINISYILIYVYIFTYTYTYICGYFTAISLLTNGCDVFFVLSPAKACPWFDHFDLSLSCWWFLRLKAFQTPPAAKITTMSTKIHHFQYMVGGVWKLTEPSWPTVEFPLPCLFTGQTVVCCLQAEGIYSKSIQKPFNSHSKKVRDAQVFWPLPPLIWQWKNRLFFCILHTFCDGHHWVFSWDQRWRVKCNYYSQLIFCLRPKKDVPSDFHHFLRVHSIS